MSQQRWHRVKWTNKVVISFIFGTVFFTIFLFQNCGSDLKLALDLQLLNNSHLTNSTDNSSPLPTVLITKPNGSLEHAQSAPEVQIEGTSEFNGSWANITCTIGASSCGTLKIQGPNWVFESVHLNYGNNLITIRLTDENGDVATQSLNIARNSLNVPAIYIDPSSTELGQDGSQARPYHSWFDIPNNNPTRIATYYFKRGTRLVWPITVHNANTTASEYVTFDAYGRGDSRKNFSQGDWSHLGKGIYSRKVGAGTQAVQAFYANSIEMQEDYFYSYFVRKGYPDIVPKRGPRPGKWVYDSANDMIYYNSSMGNPNSILTQWGEETDKPKIIGRVPINSSSWQGPLNGVYSVTVAHMSPQNLYVGDPEDSLEIPNAPTTTSPPAGYWSFVNQTIYYKPMQASAVSPSQAQYNALLYNSSTGANSTHWYGIFISKGDFTQLRNLYVKNSGRHGIWAPEASNLVLSNCRTSFNGQSLAGPNQTQTDGIGDGLSLGGNNVTVTDCESSYNQDSGISDENIMKTLKKITIKDSWLNGVGAHAISIHGNDTQPYHGVINGDHLIVEKAGNKDLLLNGYPAQDYGSANIAYNSAQSDFSYSVFDGAGGTAITIIGGLNTIVFKYCLIANSNRSGFADHSIPGAEGHESLFMNNVPSSSYLKLILHNNTFIESQAKNLYQKWSSDFFPTIEAKNNIFIAGQGKLNIEAEANTANNPSVNFDHNNFGKGTFANQIAGVPISQISIWNDKSFVGTDFSMDPMFLSESSGVFVLQSQSPLKDKGVNLGLTQDLLGAPIVGSPDIGAFEWNP